MDQPAHLVTVVGSTVQVSPMPLDPEMSAAAVEVNKCAAANNLSTNDVRLLYWLLGRNVGSQ